jgi:beta-glucosidase
VVAVRVTVRNAGAAAGREVVQVYVRDAAATVERPEQELRGFASVALAPGESREVTCLLDMRAFAFWDVALDRWFVEGGEFEIRFGASSRDIRAVAAVTLAGDPVTPPLGANSTADEWLADPARGPWLRARLEGTGYADILTDSLAHDLMGPTPLERLTRFPGFPVTSAEVAAQLLL